MARIDLRNIAHSYGSVEALQQFSLTWEDGGRYAILGPSGCGKTTMLNIMSGIIRPTKGSIHFDDRDVTDLDISQAEGEFIQIFVDGNDHANFMDIGIGSAVVLEINRIREALTLGKEARRVAGVWADQRCQSTA